MVEYLPLVFICTTSGVMVISYGVYHAVKFKDRVKYGNVDSKLLFERELTVCVLSCQIEIPGKADERSVSKTLHIQCQILCSEHEICYVVLILFVLVF